MNDANPISPSQLAEKFSGTMPVSDRYQTDLKTLEQWMQAHVDGFQGPLRIEQLRNLVASRKLAGKYIEKLYISYFYHRHSVLQLTMTLEKP